MFDMRMPGKYDHLETGINPPQRRRSSANNYSKEYSMKEKGLQTPYPNKDISLFLSSRPPSIHSRASLLREPHRYRGPIYTMSMPSSSSSTVYVGVEAGILRLDMACTDDLTGPLGSWYRQNISLGYNSENPVHKPFELSCYERPWLEDQGRGVRLMMQEPLSLALEQQDEKVRGWDRRWFQPWVAHNRRLRGPWRRPSEAR